MPAQIIVRNASVDVGLSEIGIEADRRTVVGQRLGVPAQGRVGDAAVGVVNGREEVRPGQDRVALHRPAERVRRVGLEEGLEGLLRGVGRSGFGGESRHLADLCGNLCPRGVAQASSGFEGLEGIVPLVPLGMESALDEVGLGVVGIESDRRVVVGQGFGVPAQGFVGVAAVDVGLGEVGVESDRRVVVDQRLGVPAQGFVGVAAVGVGRGEVGIEADGRVEVGQRLGVPA